MTAARAPAVVAPALAALLGLAGSLGATLWLHRSAGEALDRVLVERLAGAGQTAAGLLGGAPPDPAALRAVMAANGLEGASVIGPGPRVLADAAGGAGGALDLLRFDVRRVDEAFAGRSSVAFGWELGSLRVAVAYHPIRGADGRVLAVLALEAGQGFAAARGTLRRALAVGVALSVVGAAALALAARRWSRAEALRRADAERAVRGEALARMAAMVAHEVRNPIGVIRSAAELVTARSGSALGEKDRAALADVLGEVDRLRRMTEDFLDLAREPKLEPVEVGLAELAAEAARGLARTHPSLSVQLGVAPLRVLADPGRTRQVLENLLANAAQAGATRAELTGAAAEGEAVLAVQDDGPGVDPALRERLFDPFVTGRAGGTGLGLAIARRLLERQGGGLRLVESPRGARFEVRLPLAGG
jgi:two-component system OmpR family sensor kinase